MINWNINVIFHTIIDCTFKSFGFDSVVKNEGNNLGLLKGKFNQCRERCNSINLCNSFSYCRDCPPLAITCHHNCHFKDRKLTGNEETISKGSCKTFYKTCKGTQLNFHNF